MIKRFYFLLVVLTIMAGLNTRAQIARANGYKGIWFTLGQFSEYGDKYSGGLGTYTSSHIPIAVYSKKVNKTFFVYGGTTRENERHLLIMLSYYDHKTHMVPKPVIVYDKVGVDDPHDNASLSIDENGFIWIFVSGRNTARPGIIFKGRVPFGIDSFEQIKIAEMTYPQPWWVPGKGFLYLFTKYTKGRELYWSTSADGKSWEPDQKLAGMGGHYQVSNMNNGKLFTIFNYHPNGDVDKRTNIYLLQTADMGKTWTNINGKPVLPPLTSKRSDAMVKDFEAESKLVYLNDLNFDKNGNPVILAIISRDFKPGPNGNPREWMVIQWKDGQWNFHKICESTHNYDMGSLYIEKDQWRVIGPTETGPQKFGTGGEMALWESSNEGRSWTKKRLLTANSKRNNSYARRPLLAHPDFYSLWADGDADKLSRSELHFSNSKGDVWTLPYNMEKDFEKPVRLK